MNEPEEQPINTRRAPHMERYTELTPYSTEDHPAGMQLRLKIGVQSFLLSDGVAGHFEEPGHAEWTRDMLCNALDKLRTDVIDECIGVGHEEQVRIWAEELVADLQAYNHLSEPEDYEAVISLHRTVQDFIKETIFARISELKVSPEGGAFTCDECGHFFDPADERASLAGEGNSSMAYCPACAVQKLGGKEFWATWNDCNGVFDVYWNRRDAIEALSKPGGEAMSVIPVRVYEEPEERHDMRHFFENRREGKS